jgi:hypothetical protein
MGLTGRYRRRLIERLELGQIRKPTVETVIRYLQACGAHRHQFVELAESLTPAVSNKRPSGQDSARFQSYRIVAEAIEQAVAEELKQTDLLPSSYAFYRAVARQALGVLWRETRRAMQGKQPNGTELRLQDKLEAKDAEWRKQKLDMALVARVRDVVVEEFARLLKKRPDLFGSA